MRKPDKNDLSFVHDPPGAGLGLVVFADDIRNRYQLAYADTPERRGEALVSLAGNKAGRRVGYAMANRIRNLTSAADLVKNIKSELCD